MKKLILLVFIAMFLITGCECISGLGRDVQRAGKWMEDQGKRAQ